MLKELHQLVHVQLEDMFLMELEDVECHGEDDVVPLQQEHVPDSQGQAEGDSVQETLQEPFDGVNTSIHVL